MNRRAFYLQTSYGIAGLIEQKLEMSRGVHFRFAKVVPSYKVLTLWLVINPTFVKKLKAMTEELSLAALLPKGELIRVELGGRGVIELQIPFPEGMRISPHVSKLPTLSRCQAAVGIDTEDRLATVDFDNPLTAHCLISGLTGSGKTNLARLLIYLLARQNKPDALRFLLFDVADAGAAWVGFENMPHLYHGIIDNMSIAGEGIAWLAGELDRRSQTREKVPKLVVGIDECQVFAKESNMAGTLEDLSRRGRKWGMSLMLLTQRPTSDSLAPTTKANCGIKVVGKVATAQESAWASGLPDLGGEGLAGLGDMLLCKHAGGVTRIACPLLTDEHLANLPPPNGHSKVTFPDLGPQEEELGPESDFTPTEYMLSLIGAGRKKGRPWLKDVLEYETGHRPGSKRASRLLKWGQEAHRVLGRYQYRLALTPDP